MTSNRDPIVSTVLRRSALIGAALLVALPASADWIANADFSSCPRQYFPNTHAQEGPFATQEQCAARVSQVQRDMQTTCARYSCDERGGSGGGGGGGKAAAGHELDQNINDAISAGLQGKISAGDTASLVTMGVLGNALLGGMAEDTPEEKARKAAKRQARLEREAEEARQRAAAEDARSAGLLDSMLDTADQQLDTQVALPAAPAAPAAAAFAPGSTPHWTAEPATPPPATGELGMMLDDGPIPTAGASAAPVGAAAGSAVAGQGFMPNRAPPQPIRNEPRAVIKQPTPQQNCGGGGALLGAMMCDEDSPAPAPAPAAVPGLLPAPAPAAAPAPPAADPFIVGVNRGRDHADGCYSQNAGPACSDQTPANFDRCVEGYRRGYQIGDRVKNMRFDEAYRLGQQAKANGELNNGASQPGATGTCRIEWIQTYNSGYSGAPRL